MPLIHITTTQHMSDEDRSALLTALSTAISETTGKPEKFVMAIVQSAGMMMSGTEGGAAFADVRSIGALGPDENAAISARICDVLRTGLSIPGERIYLNFSDVARTDWGWDGRTFG